MEGPTTKQHKQDAPKNVECAIITLSDSRTLNDDVSGNIIKSLLEKEKHIIIEHVVIPDEGKLLVKEIKKLTSKAKVIITTGGTGIAKRDITVDSLEKLFNKKITAFSSIFAKLSYDDIGSSAIMSRATAGIINQTVIFCLPGSPKAVELGVKKLILPEIGHIVKHLK
ncbi:MAG: molybdenum cofactor biosynthesis protein B [Candidatus Woesearchaeota archaeon]|jgi:molybdenum cofactor biosynthesis protein B